MIKVVAFDIMGVLFPENLILKKLGRIGDNKKLEYLRLNNCKGKLISKINKPFEKIEKKIIDKINIDLTSYEIVEYLQKKYSLSIISDLPKIWGDYLINKYKLDKVFDPIIISGKVGVTKKHKKIFEILIKNTKTKPEEIIFIDNEKENLKTAFDLGIKTVWFNIEKDNFKFEPDYTIKSLKELKKIL